MAWAPRFTPSHAHEKGTLTNTAGQKESRKMTVGVAEAGEGVEKEHHLVHHGRVGRRERVGRLLGKRLAKALEPPRLL